MRAALVGFLLATAALILPPSPAPRARRQRARPGDDPRVPQDRLPRGALDADARELPARPGDALRQGLPAAGPERAGRGTHHGAGGHHAGRAHLRRLLARPVPLHGPERQPGDRSQVGRGRPGGLHQGEAGLRAGRDLLRAARAPRHRTACSISRSTRAASFAGSSSRATRSATTRCGTPTSASTTRPRCALSWPRPRSGSSGMCPSTALRTLALPARRLSEGDRLGAQAAPPRGRPIVTRRS